MTALLKLIPLRVWIELAGALILGILFWWYTVHERDIGAAKTHDAVVLASDKAKETAHNEVAAELSDYALALKASQEKRDADVNAAAAHAADLGERLRNLEAHGGSHGTVPGAAAPGTPAAACAGSDSEVIVPRAVYEQLIAVEAAAEHDHAVVISERAERDSLTGK